MNNREIYSDFIITLFALVYYLIDSLIVPSNSFLNSRFILDISLSYIVVLVINLL